jgi:hypothetical protein
MSFELSTKYDHANSCPVCLEGFTIDEPVLAHDNDICPIHPDCLQGMLNTSINPRCALCSKRITHVQGIPLQPAEQPARPAPLAPLPEDAVNIFLDEAPPVQPRQNLLELRDYRERENRRFLGRRFLQSLVPGQLENLARNQILVASNGFNGSSLPIGMARRDRDDFYKHIFLIFCSTAFIFYFMANIDVFFDVCTFPESHTHSAVFSCNRLMGVFSVALGLSLGATAAAVKNLWDLHETVKEFGYIFFLTEADQE